MCWCTVLLKAVHSFVLDVSTSLPESIGGPGGYVGKSIPLASIRKHVYVILLRLIIKT